MRQALIPIFLLMAASLSAQEARDLPSWLAAFPGAAEQTRRTSVLTQSTYTASAAPHEVIDHYRSLFASAGVPFRPVAMGYGFLIRADSEGCDLTIRIQKRADSTSVQITCVPIKDPEKTTTHVLEQAEQSERQQIRSMEKYDKPVYPRPQAPNPAPAWPAWLVDVAGRPLRPQKGTIGTTTYLKATYNAGGAKADVQAFYAGLLTANGFSMRSQSSASVPAQFRSWLEGESYPEGRSGPRLLIRVDIVPTGRFNSVELRISRFPKL